MRFGIISTVGGGYSWAGSEEMWRLFSEFVLVEGHDVRVNIASSMAQSPELDHFKSLGGKVVGRAELSGITRRMAKRNLHSRFSDFANSNDDMIVLSMGAIADCVWIPDLLQCYWKSKVPWVIIVQGNGDNIISNESQREVLRRFYAKAKLVIFVSQQNKLLAERQLAWRFPNSKVLSNPIREPLSEPLPWPTQCGIFRFAEVARLDVLQKRQDQLLEALSHPDWRERPWQLTFYGSGPDEHHIRSLVNLYGLSDKVVLGGYVRNIKDIWKDNHIHIFPTSYEGLSLSLIESMFCGRPALVTRAGDNAVLVRDSVDGFVSPGMHPEIIRETLERAWNARDKWQEMGQHSFDRASDWMPENIGEVLFWDIFSLIPNTD
jgi:glycosyltransferase involved in cell wall biosynthesis